MKYEIKTLGELSIGKKGSYGIAAPAVEYSSELYTYLRITDINDDGTIKKDGLMSVADEKASEYRLYPNDIVFARTGASTGRNYFFDGSDGEFVYAGFLIKFSIDERLVNPYYIKYFCQSDIYKQWVQSFQTGSTRGNINAKTYADMSIIIPPREQQDFLVSILKPIDEKIAINNAINKNLMEQAQAIYTEMFITNSNPSWKIGTLTDLVNVKYGKDHKKLEDGQYPVYGSGGIMRFVERPLYDKESVLIPRKGSLNNVMYVNEPFWSVDTMFYTEMKQSNVAKFVFHFVKGIDLASLNAGSAVPSMTTAILDALQLQIPDDVTLEKFEQKISPMYEAIHNNEMQSDDLANIRDTILPRLMAGEIDVSSIEI